MDRVKSTIMKGLGRSTHTNDTASQTTTEQQRTRSIDQPTHPASSSPSSIPGHVEPDFSDMTAEWQPNPMESSGDRQMAKRVLGGNSMTRNYMPTSKQFLEAQNVFLLT